MSTSTFLARPCPELVTQQAHSAFTGPAKLVAVVCLSNYRFPYSTVQKFPRVLHGDIRQFYKQSPLFTITMVSC